MTFEHVDKALFFITLLVGCGGGPAAQIVGAPLTCLELSPAAETTVSAPLSTGSGFTRLPTLVATGDPGVVALLFAAYDGVHANTGYQFLSPWASWSSLELSHGIGSIAMDVAGPAPGRSIVTMDPAGTMGLLSNEGQEVILGKLLEEDLHNWSGTGNFIVPTKKGFLVGYKRGVMDCASPCPDGTAFRVSIFFYLREISSTGEAISASDDVVGCAGDRSSTTLSADALPSGEDQLIAVHSSRSLGQCPANVSHVDGESSVRVLRRSESGDLEETSLPPGEGGGSLRLVPRTDGAWLVSQSYSSQVSVWRLDAQRQVNLGPVSIPIMGWPSVAGIGNRLVVMSADPSVTSGKGRMLMQLLDESAQVVQQVTIDIDRSTTVSMIGSARNDSLLISEYLDPNYPGPGLDPSPSVHLVRYDCRTH